MKHFPYLTLVCAALAAAAYALPASGVLQYDRTALVSGEWWRLVTCQWTHWSISHLFWDTAVLVALGATCERRGRVRFSATVLCAAIVIPATLYRLDPAVDYFRGLSGIDCALFGLLVTDNAAAAWRARRHGIFGVAVLAGALFVGKSLAEAKLGRPLFAQAGDFTVATTAHWCGFVVGVLWGVVPGRWAGRKIGGVSASLAPALRVRIARLQSV